MDFESLNLKYLLGCIATVVSICICMYYYSKVVCMYVDAVKLLSRNTTASIIKYSLKLKGIKEWPAEKHT